MFNLYGYKIYILDYFSFLLIFTHALTYSGRNWEKKKNDLTCKKNPLQPRQPNDKKLITEALVGATPAHQYTPAKLNHCVPYMHVVNFAVDAVLYTRTTGFSRNLALPGKMLSSQLSQTCSDQITDVDNTFKSVLDLPRLNLYCPLECRPCNEAKKPSHTQYNVDDD